MGMAFTNSWFAHSWIICAYVYHIIRKTYRGNRISTVFCLCPFFFLEVNVIKLSFVVLFIFISNSGPMERLVT